MFQIRSFSNYPVRISKPLKPDLVGPAVKAIYYRTGNNHRCVLIVTRNKNAVSFTQKFDELLLALSDKLHALMMSIMSRSVFPNLGGCRN